MQIGTYTIEFDFLDFSKKFLETTLFLCVSSLAVSLSFSTVDFLIFFFVVIPWYICFLAFYIFDGIRVIIDFVL